MQDEFVRRQLGWGAELARAGRLLCRCFAEFLVVCMESCLGLLPGAWLRACTSTPSSARQDAALGVMGVLSARPTAVLWGKGWLR